MSQADAKNRNFVQQGTNRFDSVVQRFRVAWTVRQEDAIWIQIQDILSRTIAGKDGYFTAQLAQMTREYSISFRSRWRQYGRSFQRRIRLQTDSLNFFH